MKYVQTRTKKRYIDNAEFHYKLYTGLTTFLSELSRCFDLDENNLSEIISKKESFKKVILNSKMKNISANIVDTIFDLKERIVHANETPHSEIEVSDRRR